MLDAHFESLLPAAQTGAEWALSALYQDLQPPLLRYLSAQEPAEGEDLASEVWLDVAHGLPRFEGDESGFRCWVFTIARRRLIDFRRRQARRRTDPVALEQLADRQDPSEAFSAVETGIRPYLDALPPEQAEIVLLRVLGGLDSNEVAAVTGRRPGTVRVMQKRALERLAELVPRESRTGVTQ
ncbi:MAG TPA: sigma-70 family RNA polymerase sigma factor [Gaiellaceae bacterium]|jgi:RNA polymerase sigma-70 factor (ECF subfamily)